MSRFRPVYSTICRCEIFPGERNSFSFSLGPVVKSTSDLVNARPRSFDDVRPDRDANTFGKPSELVKTVGREARSFGSPLRSKAWNTIGIESMGGTILPTDFFLSRHQIFRAKLGLAAYLSIEWNNRFPRKCESDWWFKELSPLLSLLSRIFNICNVCFNYSVIFNRERYVVYNFKKLLKARDKGKKENKKLRIRSNIRI